MIGYASRPIQRTADGSGEWELFNLETDPAKTTDRSKQEPARKKAMLALSDQYAAENGVILTDDGPFKAKNSNQSFEPSGCHPAALTVFANDCNPP